AWIGLDLVDNGGNVAYDRLRETQGDGLPMALQEHESHDRLQQDHGRYDDDERTGIEPLGHVARDQPPEVAPARADSAGQIGKPAADGPSSRLIALSFLEVARCHCS